MKFTLKRTDIDVTGAYGKLLDEQGNVVAYTIEHAYDMGHGDGSYSPKLPAGTYTCKRGMHRLHGMTHDFETFEITNVPNHKGILLHTGNWGRQSDGCILVGKAVMLGPDGIQMVISSRETFAKLMSLVDGLDNFKLVVE